MPRCTTPKKIHHPRLRQPALSDFKQALQMTFIPNRLFYYRNAEKKLWDVPTVEKVDTDWYNRILMNREKDPGTLVTRFILTDEQEYSLFLQYNYCKYMALRLAKRCKGKISLREVNQVLSWYHRANDIRDTIMSYNYGLLLSVVWRIYGYGNFYSKEILAEAHLSLIRAVDGFDVNWNNRFSTYAYYAVYNNTITFVKSKKDIPTDFESWEQPSNQRFLRILCTETSYDRDSINEETMLDKLKDALKTNAVKLNKMEKMVLKARYLHHQDKNPTFKEIQKKLAKAGIQRTIALFSETERRALKRLRKYLQTENFFVANEKPSCIIKPELDKG
jgi:RNA polymerase sigma factor (sigma-70 family)